MKFIKEDVRLQADCDWCDGTGECPECDGFGDYENGYECEFCLGSGECTACGGTGRDGE